jgi:ABC-type nickel/cobalt efflux system permease component RcnA
MKRLVVLLTVAAALIGPAAASAHPLGNFTINRFSRVEVSGPRVYVRYVLDLAEIPTFQAGQIDRQAYATRIARNAKLELDGRPATLVPLRTALAHPLGAGGLHTTRFEVILRGPLLDGSTHVTYHDGNYSDRIGWKEIVVGTTAPSKSHELRAYPKDLLESPLDVTSASASLSPASGADVAPPLSNGTSLQAPDRIADAGFASLVGRSDLSLLVILASLAAALFWGAAHALSPGHGKTIITAYLVGQRGTPRHAALLGLIVTITHTIGVFSLGLVTLALSQFIVPDRLYPWLTLVSGLLVVCVGFSVFLQRLRSGVWHGRHRHTNVHGHDHGHGHDHTHDHHDHHDDGHHHDHGHDDPDAEPLTSRGILGVGVAAGILPCPSALVVLLSAIALHRVGFGIVLILAFSLGLAATITGIGLVAVLARRAFSRVSFEGRLVRALPALSALVILCVGVAITAKAIPGVL